MKLILHRYILPLRHVFTIARGSRSQQATLIVELREGNHRGFGEAPESAYFNAQIDVMAQRLQTLAPHLANIELEDPMQLWEQCAGHLRDLPFAQCALDEAAHDLWGKKHNRSVRQMWSEHVPHPPLSDYTIGIDTIDTMVAKLKEFADWPIFKIKLGSPNDVQVLQALRQQTQSILRVDANAGWTLPQAQAMLPILTSLNIELIEQPLATQALHDMLQLMPQSTLPLIADESCVAETDVAACAKFFHGINIKIAKCGGLTPARRMLQQARQQGLKVMLGCMTESTVGISAIAQLAPWVDYLDLDGAVLLAQDTAQGVRVERGQVIYPDMPGTGVQLNEI